MYVYHLISRYTLMVFKLPFYLMHILLLHIDMTKAIWHSALYLRNLPQISPVLQMLVGSLTLIEKLSLCHQPISYFVPYKNAIQITTVLCFLSSVVLVLSINTVWRCGIWSLSSSFIIRILSPSTCFYHTPTYIIQLSHFTSFSPSTSFGSYFNILTT